MRVFRKKNTAVVAKQTPREKLKYVKKNWQLYVFFLLPGLLLTLIFKYGPMGGILMTWRDIFWSPGFHPGRFLLLAPVCLAVFLFGRWLFRRLEPRFAEMM